MKLTLWPDSITTRVTLSALGVFVLSVWVFAFLTTRILEQDISQLVADAQISATAQIAAQLDRELGGRLAALEQIASKISADSMDNPAAVQQLLETQPLLQDLFNVSVLAVNSAGIGIADVPLVPERIGISYLGRVDAITIALEEGRAQVGRPIIGISTGQPLIPLAVPIRDDAGQVIGALGGAIDLSQPSFFDNLTAQGYGQTGTYSVISRSRRVIVTSSNPDLIMFELPPPGVSPLLDRAIEGDERTYRYTTVQGIDSLTTVKGLDVTDWLMATITPITEAFAPITGMQRRMALVSLVVTLLVATSIGWILRRQLQPIQSTVDALGQMSASDQSLQRLPLTGRNEIDTLIGSFNRLLHALEEREQENKRFRIIADNALYGKSIADLQGNLVYVNRFFAEIHGYRPAELIGQHLSILHTADQFERVDNTNRLLHQTGYFSPREIWHVHRDGTEFPMLMSGLLLRDPQGHPQYMAASAVDITERKQAEAEIYRLAYYDPLTQLPNRRLFQDRLGQAMAGSLRSGRHGALVFMDIDNFKTLNDTRGHDVGDQLLIEIGRRILAGACEGDTVARLGGDEFVVMLEELSQKAEEAAVQARKIGETMRLALTGAYSIHGGDYHCSASLGIALFNGHEQSVETLLKQADLAMYKAKDGGRNTLRFFDPAMQTTLDERIALETDLRSALALGQLTPYYQAQVDSEGRVLGAEVLLRWYHPVRGMVSPAQFIPLAEATGLILPIGYWVLEAACRQIAAWSKSETTRRWRLAVNVSARQFRQVEFVDQVRQVLAATGADPRRLRIELTESMVLDDVAGTLEKMQVLKELGISFALDDFGTGHSSLSYLTRLPLDTLKIDSSFVFNLPDSHNDAVIAQTIISMARSLGLSVIAEGVETEAQRAFLARHQCHVYQGYLFSRPLPLAEFERYSAAI
jgi:diguanylate cyclase (GGDEF)-like protein/PAS domain S-box-containing protein